MKTFFLLSLLSFPCWAQPLLTVEANPPSALIFVDRQLRGQGTAKITDLSPGNHLLRISGGEDWETHTATIKLQSDPQLIQIQLKPGGAKLLRNGRQALQQSNWSEALRSFQQAALSRPVAAAWWEGIAQWRAGRYKLAIQSFRTYAQYMPKVGQLHWILGSLHEKTGKFGPAFTAYKSAALLQPELANALVKLPEPTEANITKLSRSSAQSDRLRLAQILMLKGQMQKACETIKPLLAREFTQQDWLNWEPPLPKDPVIEVAPPEDQEP